MRLFVVLNKADYLAAGDLDRTVTSTERVVRQVLPDCPGPVYPLSARPGTGDPAGMRRFAADLARFLREDRAAVVTDSARRAAARGLGSLQPALELERQAANLPAEEVATRRAQSRPWSTGWRLPPLARGYAVAWTIPEWPGTGRTVCLTERFNLRWSAPPVPTH